MFLFFRVLLLCPRGETCRMAREFSSFALVYYINLSRYIIILISDMYSQINCGRYSYKLISTSPVNYFLLIANNLSGIMLNSIIVQCLCKRCTSVTSWKAFYFLLCSTFFMAFENTWTKLKYKASGESHPSTALVGSGKEHSEPEPLQLTTITSTHVAVDRSNVFS